VYARSLDDRVLTFDFALGLVHDNLLISDRETNSLWSQLHGKAIAGPEKDVPLRMVASIQTTWRHWHGMHPDSKVGMRQGDWGRRYWYHDPGKKQRRPEHDTSVLGLGVTMKGEALFVPLRAVEDGDYRVRLGREQIVIHARPSEFTAWAESNEGELLSAVLVYEPGWRSFFPGTRVFDPSINAKAAVRSGPDEDAPR